jgi:hypothetical protein
MAQSALVRVTGKVLALPEPRSGVSQKTGKPWEIATANVLVANQNVTVVQLPSRDFGGFRRPQKDDVVDYLCEVSIYGANVQTTVQEVFPEEYDAASLQLQQELGASV